VSLGAPSYKIAAKTVRPSRYRVGVSEKLRFTIAYDEPDEEGWLVAGVVEVPGAVSQGRTREEARENVDRRSPTDAFS